MFKTMKLKTDALSVFLIFISISQQLLPCSALYKKVRKIPNQTKFRKLETKIAAFALLEELFKRCYREHISWYALKQYAFCKTATASQRCSLKYLFSNLRTCQIKMSVVHSIFSSVVGRPLSSLLKLVTTTEIFHHFSSDFSKSIYKIRNSVK